MAEMENVSLWHINGHIHLTFMYGFAGRHVDACHESRLRRQNRSWLLRWQGCWRHVMSSDGPEDVKVGCDGWWTRRIILYDSYRGSLCEHNLLCGADFLDCRRFFGTGQSEQSGYFFLSIWSVIVSQWYSSGLRDKMFASIYSLKLVFAQAILKLFPSQ